MFVLRVLTVREPGAAGQLPRKMYAVEIRNEECGFVAVEQRRYTNPLSASLRAANLAALLGDAIVEGSK